MRAGRPAGMMSAMSAPPPGPRHYPPIVTLVRSLTRDPAELPGATDPDQIEAWLLADAMREDDTLALVEGFAWRLAMADLGVDRLSLHVGTLHPQAIGFSWNWSRADATCDEIRVAPEATTHDSFRQSPLQGVILNGERFRASTGDPTLSARYPILAELSRQGLTDYAAFPIGVSHGRHNAATLATRRPGGFPAGAAPVLGRLFRLFALHMQRHVARRIAENIVRTYLGPEVGRRVLDGQVRRDMGETGESVVWFSDLRGYTQLSDRLAPDVVLAVLNAYCEIMVGAVRGAGGEVLKFMGDGLLAGFGGPAFGGRRGEAVAALGAARQALSGLAALNAAPPPELAAMAGWAPLATGIALHAGESFFGNIGSRDRLDFTVIGKAVNVASRVEGLCRPLGRPILVTDAVARHLDEPLDALGEHALKGIAEPVRVFGVRL